MLKPSVMSVELSFWVVFTESELVFRLSKLSVG